MSITMNALPVIVLSFGVGLTISAALATTLFRLRLRTTPLPLLIAVGLASAVAASFSPGRPTAVHGANIALRAVMGALFVVASFRAHRRELVGVAIAIAVAMALGAQPAGVDPWVLGLAVGGAGTALAGYLHPDRVPLFAALIGALTAQSALRLPTTLPSRTPSLIAVAALLVLFGSGWAGLPIRLRRLLIRSSIVAAAAAMVCAVAGGVSLLKARTPLEAGIEAAKAGLRAARSGDTGAADTAFASALSNITSAQTKLHTPLARVGLFTPVAAQHIDTIRRLSDVAADVVTAGQQTASRADLQSFKAEGGRVDVQRMRALQTQVVAADDTITRARTALDRAQGPWLLSPLTDRITSLRTQVDDAARSTADVRQILQTVPAMLGADGERHYLLVLPSPAEARGSGGVIGNYGEITAVQGAFTLTRFGRTTELNNQGTPADQRYLQAPGDYVARYTRFGAASTWSNLTMSPDFPSAAEAMANMYPQSGGRSVDGVISADPFALEAFLRLLGPMTVSGWDTPLDGTNAARILLHDAYVTKGGSSPERIALLADVAQGVWTKLSQASLPNPKGLADALAPAVRTRHLQVWMRNGTEQDYLTRIGIAGNVPPLAGDGLGVIVNNAGANKIEWYLHRDIAYSAMIDPAKGTVNATATITLRNDAPAQGEPDYIIGNRVETDALPPGTSRLYVSVYSPLGLSGATLDGRPLTMTAQVERGRNVFSGWVTIASTSRAVLTMQLVGPIPGGKDGYRLDVFGQPLVNADQVTVTLQSLGRKLVPGDGLAGTDQLDGITGSDHITTFTAAYD